eukprot:gene7298-7511_t
MGVPGDWVTGNRMLDVLVLPLIFAVAFPLLRVTLTKHVFQPAGIAVFERVQKKKDLSWTQQQLSDKLVKWNESCWKLVVYTFFSATAFLVTFREPFFADPYYFWTDANAFPLNYYVPLKTLLFYCVEIGFYIQAIPFLIFIEVRRKDWLESFAHHLVTLGVMYYSWWANFTRAGLMVMLLHDISDILLEGAKLAKYADKEQLALQLFVSFALSWIILRVIIFPYMVVFRMLVDPIIYIAVPYNIDAQPHYSILGTLHLLLFFLHLYWTYLILKVIVKQLRTGSTTDVREDDSDDD